MPDGVPRSELIKNPDYKKLLNDTYGFFTQNDPTLPTDKRFLQTFPNAEKMKFWDIASERFVAEAPAGTNFRLLVGTDNFDSGKLSNTVLMRKELPALFNRTDVFVDGNEIAKFKLGNNLDAFKTSVYAHAAKIVELAKDADGTFIPERYKSLSSDKNIQNYLNDLNSLAEAGDESAKSILRRVHDNSSTLKHLLSKLPSGGAKLLKSLGPIGLVLSFYLVSEEAKAAESSGNHEQAKEIWIEWGVGELGSEIASAAGGFLAGLFVFSVVGLSAPVAAIAAISVSILSGIYGEDFAKDLYHLTKDMDKNQRIDLLDRMSTLAFGQDFNVADLPAALEKHAVKLNIGDISLENLITKAQTDIAYRYALRELTPFVAEGADYSAYNTDGSLDLLGKDNPNGMSAEYIKSRAEMLLLQMRYLKNGLKLGRDLTDDITQGDWDYLDYGKHPFAGNPDRPLEFSIDGDGISTDDHRIAFGSSNDDIIEGSGKSDRLFGAEGNDTLKGGAGSDYMEGGQGYDTYHIQDNDTVSDSDMRGRILFPNKVPATETSEETILGYDAVPSFFTKSKNDANKWEAPNPKGEYYPFSAEQKDNDLIIRRGSDSVTVKDYFARAAHTKDSGGSLWSGLGIQLLDKPADTAQVYHSVEKFASKPVKLNNFQIRANPAENVIIQGNDGVDIVMPFSAKSVMVDAAGGDDVVYGLKNGGNVLLGGEGRDMLLGANYGVRDADAGIDMLVGNAGSDLIDGMGGKDIIYTGDINEHLSEEAGGEKGDWALGHSGDDLLYGSRGSDFLQGGADSDKLYGGAGDDVLLGDGDVQFNSKWNYVGSTSSSEAFLTGPGGGNETVKIDGGGIGLEHEVTGGGYETDKWQERSRFPHADMHHWTLAIDRQKGDYRLDDALIRKNTALAENGAADYLYGGAGNDLMIGQTGDDFLYGEKGNDILWGDDNRDLSVAGNDYLDGGEGNDTLYGGLGNDTLAGGTGSNTLDGGEGFDTYVITREEFAQTAATPAEKKTHNIIRDSDGQGKILIQDMDLGSLHWQLNKGTGKWSARGQEIALAQNGSDLLLQNKDGITVATVSNFQNGNLGITLPGFSVQTDKPKSEPAPTPQPVQPEPVQPEPVQPQPVQPQPVQPQPVQPQPVQPQPVQPQPVQPQPVQPQPVQPQPVQPQPVQPEPVQPEPVQPEPVQPEPVQPEPVQPVPVQPAPATQTVIEGGSGNETLHAALSGSLVKARGGNDWVHGNTGNDTLIGGVGNDVLYGRAGHDELYGEDGDDRLYGGEGDDKLAGGRGNDYLAGGAGSDRYVIERNFGKDFIINLDTSPNSTDTLRITDGYTPDDFTFKRDGDNLVITEKADSRNEITVHKHFSADYRGAYAVDRIVFDNQTVLDTQAVNALVRQDAALANAANHMVQAMAGFGAGSGATAGNLMQNAAHQPLLLAASSV